MICIFHSRDLDGWSSAAIVKRKYPDVKLIGYDYGQPIPWDEITPGEPVIMVDVSFPMKDMSGLAVISGHQFTWIDHHITAINDFENYKDIDLDSITPVLENGISACEGTWKYLFPDERMPIAIELLGIYDTWRNADRKKWEVWVMPFQYGMRLRCNSPESFPIHLLDHKTTEIGMREQQDEILRINQDGIAVLAYQSHINITTCKKSAFECQFEGLRAIAMNSSVFNSDIFKSVYDPEKHDVMMPFQFNGKEWVISMYTTKDIDLSVIAKKHGGGGHAKACGMQVKCIEEIFPVIQQLRYVWERSTTY